MNQEFPCKSLLSCHEQSRLLPPLPLPQQRYLLPDHTEQRPAWLWVAFYNGGWNWALDSSTQTLFQAARLSQKTAEKRLEFQKHPEKQRQETERDRAGEKGVLSLPAPFGLPDPSSTVRLTVSHGPSSNPSNAELVTGNSTALFRNNMGRSSLSRSNNHFSPRLKQLP